MSQASGRALRVLLVEDDDDDATMVERELRAAGFRPSVERVVNAGELGAALGRGPWDIVLSDYSLPGFGAPAALALVRGHSHELPFVVVSGSVGEDKAVAMMRGGATDWISKDRMSRLGPAIERELREAQIRHQAARVEARLQILVEALSDLVFEVGPDGRVAAAHGRFELAVGQHAVDLVGLATTDPRLPPEFAALATRALAGETVELEWSAPLIGEPRWLHARIAPLRTRGQIAGAVGVIRDVTEIKRGQSQLAIADRMATIGGLASGVAHEINNPLASALLNLELIDREMAGGLGAPAGHERLRAELDDVRAAVERVRDIARDLRLFARSDDADAAAVDLADVLRSSGRMAWSQLRHRAQLVERFEPTPPVLATASRLGQVFLNLLINAGDAMADGAADRNTVTMATRTAPDGRAIAEISDTGSGMPAEVLARLFTPFFTTKPAGVGTGLGLTICHRIVSALGGVIEVDSAPGRGTTFRIVMPAANPVAQPAPPLAGGVEPAEVRRGHILVVDDEAMVARAVRRSLESRHQVAVEASGGAALARISSGERFDVILCDLMMPVMSGADLHEALSAAAPDQAARMVFMTGGAFSIASRAFLDRVANPRLEKPFDPSQVLGLIHQLMR